MVLVRNVCLKLNSKLQGIDGINSLFAQGGLHDDPLSKAIAHDGSGSRASPPRNMELLKEEIDQMIRHNQISVALKDQAVYGFEGASLASNSPCEDTFAIGQCRESGSYMFGIFDGHSGPFCSMALAARLFDYVVLSLLPRRNSESSKQILKAVHTFAAHESSPLINWLANSASVTSSTWSRDRHVTNLAKFVEEKLLKTDGSFVTIRNALQNAFEGLDEDFSANAQPDPRGAIPYADLRLVTSGSCACVVHVDGPHLHIANVGDSMAIMGVCSDTGAWTARRLTLDHTCENPDEVERLKNKHPVKEGGTILRGGRLLGELYPLRAFGDVRYKWTGDLQKVLFEALGSEYELPANFESPPYLTAVPEVFYHRLTPSDRFLVIASDGLWDFLTPEKVVRLLSDHMHGRQTLSPYARTPDSGSHVDKILEDLRERKKGARGRDIKDANGATHLIRHALGGSNGSERHYQQLAYYLSLPQNVVRNYRDDITITVIYFDTEYLSSQ